MGLWNWIVTQATGVDPAAEQARSDTANAKLTASNQVLVDNGTWTQAQGDAANADIAKGDASTGDDNVMGAIDAEAVAGLKDGLNNILNAPGNATNALGKSLSQMLWGIIKSIPWWVWVGAAAALFVWMGGLELLKGRLKKA